MFAVIFSPSPFPSFLKFTNLFAWTLFAFLIAFHINEEYHVRFLLFLILEAGLAMFIAGYLPFLGQFPDAPNRFTSIFAQSDVFGGFLLLMLPASCVMFLLAHTHWEQFVFASATVFLGGAVFMTFSRGTWIALAITLTMIIATLSFLQNKFAVKRFLFLIITGIIILTVFNKLYSSNGSLIKQLLKRTASIQNLDDASVRARFSFWDGAIKMAIKYPIFGVGEGNFGKVFPKFQKEFYYYSRFPHNWYLQVASETGFFALFALLWFLYHLIIQNWRSIFSERNLPLFTYKLAILSSVTAALLHLFVDVESNFSTYSIVLFIELGLLIALTKTPAAEENLFSQQIQGKRFKTFYLLLIFVILFGGSLQLVSYWGESFMDKAKLAYEAGKLKEAQRFIAIAGKLTPVNSAVLESQGIYSAKQFQITKNISDLLTAISFQKKAIQWDRTQASYYVGLSHLFSALPDKKIAIVKCKEALQAGLLIDPVNYPYFYAKVAELLFIEGKLEESGSWYMDIIRRHPKNSLSMLAGFRYRDFFPYVVSAYTGIGKIAAAKHDFYKAKRWFEKALEFVHEPSAQQEILAAKFYLGQLELSENKFDKAILYFEEVAKNRYFEIPARQYLAFAFFKTGKIQRAKKETSLILSLQPDNTEVLLLHKIILKRIDSIRSAK